MIPANNIHPDILPEWYFIWTYYYWNIEAFILYRRDYRPCIVDPLDDDTFNFDYQDYGEA